MQSPVPDQVPSGTPQVQSVPQPTYPWSKRSLILPPPVLLPNAGVAPATNPSPSPFPRSGHALPATATATGELFLFGGLAGDVIRNDLYLFSTTNVSATLVQTSGDIPSARKLHTCALMGSVLIVWGGDTKSYNETDPDANLDDGLYLLNLGSREWTKVLVTGPIPTGRFGHASCIVGSKLFIFGGQADEEFLDDLWMFDLNSLRTRAAWEQVQPVDGSPIPAKRTGHVCVAYGESIILFGGTDRQVHYNDTWVFDTTTRVWSELNCIGFIPSPRDGHAAVLIDDVVYVFGGRGADGSVLGDLYAFKLSNRRWYTFRGMGPAPSPRSGHAMASAGSRGLVLGGIGPDVENPATSEGTTAIHILDTRHIKYPGETSNAPLTGLSTRPSGQASVSSQSTGLDRDDPIDITSE